MKQGKLLPAIIPAIIVSMGLGAGLSSTALADMNPRESVR